MKRFHYRFFSIVERCTLLAWSSNNKEKSVSENNFSSKQQLDLIKGFTFIYLVRRSQFFRCWNINFKINYFDEFMLLVNQERCIVLVVYNKHTVVTR